jgi:hypothetical protein
MGWAAQALTLDGLAGEAAALALDVRSYREGAAGLAWSETRAHAFDSLESFQRRLRSISLRRSELLG